MNRPQLDVMKLQGLEDPATLSRIPRRNSGPILSVLFTIRMFPHMLLAIPFFVMGTFLGMIDTFPILILALVAINQPFTI